MTAVEPLLHRAEKLTFCWPIRDETVGMGTMSSGCCLCDLNLAPILGMLYYSFFCVCDQLETSFMTPWETQRNHLSVTWNSLGWPLGSVRDEIRQKQRTDFNVCSAGGCLLPLEWHARNQGSDSEVKLHSLAQLSVCTLQLLPSSRISGEPVFLCSRLLFLRWWWLQCWGHHWVKT